MEVQERSLREREIMANPELGRGGTEDEGEGAGEVGDVGEDDGVEADEGAEEDDDEALEDDNVHGEHGRGLLKSISKLEV